MPCHVSGTDTVLTVLVRLVGYVYRAVLMILGCMVTNFTDVLRGIHIIGPQIITHHANARTADRRGEALEIDRAQPHWCFDTCLDLLDVGRPPSMAPGAVLVVTPGPACLRGLGVGGVVHQRTGEGADGSSAADAGRGGAGGGYCNRILHPIGSTCIGSDGEGRRVCTTNRYGQSGLTQGRGNKVRAVARGTASQGIGTVGTGP